MLADRETLKRIVDSRWSWGRALARASRLDSAFCDVGDGFATFTGEGSPFDHAYGNFYPASLQTIMGLYRGRAASFCATPAFTPTSYNTPMGAGGKAASFESVSFRPLEGLAEIESAEGLSIERVDGLPPWADLVRTGPYGAWSDAPAPEDFAIVANAKGVARYVAHLNGQPLAAATVFASEGTALVLEVGGEATTLDRAPYDPLLAYALRESSTDLAWLATDDARTLGVAGRLGFTMAYSQVTFDVPVV